MIVDIEEKDFLQDAIDNVTEQFKEKDVFDRYLQLFLNTKYELQEVFKQIIQSRGLNEATGEQLDVIGRIVGQDRTLISAEVYEFFAMKGFPNGQTFGDLNDPSVGGVFYSVGDAVGGNLVLDDNTYRLFIKSKILKNRTASTPNELIQFLSYLFGDNTPIFIVETGNANMTIYIGRDLSVLEKSLLTYVTYTEGYPSRLIPKTVGVGVEYATFNGNQFFAFQGVPGALGFADGSGDPGFGESFGESFGGIPSDNSDGGFFASYLDIT